MTAEATVILNACIEELHGNFATALTLNMALMNQTMFLKFILFNQDMFRMNHHPSSVVQNKLCNK